MSEPRRYLRFPRPVRIEHAVAILTFTTLAVTGLVQKYAAAQLSVGIIARLGGIETVRRIHRVAAVIFMLEVVYHLGAVGYRLYVERTRPSIVPTRADVRNAWEALLYNLRLRQNRPQQGRYTFEEKVEYWAFVWGTVVMVVTGFMMWNPIATTRALPGEFIPAAKAAHGGEALLAVLAIIVWHMYHVHVRSFNRSMFTGYLSEEEMAEEHPLELSEIKAGVGPRPVDPLEAAKRRRVFLPAFGVLASALIVGIYLFATFEETAIETISPPEEVAAYSPFTPTPLPTAPPTETPSSGEIPTTWEGGLGDLFGQKCGACHSSPGATAGLDLTTYETALAGGASGAAIVPGDPDASLLLSVQSSGTHPGQLSGEELSWVRNWIEAGAPEQ